MQELEHFTEEDLKQLPSRYRAHFINSVTGYKSANLIGTQDENANANLAIFNSVVHIGSHPALLGFILRPLTVPRHTYSNIKATKTFTVNHIGSRFIEQAHQTAASYDDQQDEFEEVNLKKMYLDDFKAPYVEASMVKMGCTYVNEYPIAENGTVMIIGRIEHIYIAPGIQHADGWLQLDQIETAVTLGIDGYALPKVLDRFSYAQPGQAPKSILNETKK
ncbi:flavin reductase family protein [Croceiramulus getboli]|nr:flavin reductase [Flavobacteriaceae bacterium YJPT1-3]